MTRRAGVVALVVSVIASGLVVAANLPAGAQGFAETCEFETGLANRFGSGDPLPVTLPAGAEYQLYGVSGGYGQWIYDVVVEDTATGARVGHAEFLFYGQNATYSEDYDSKGGWGSIGAGRTIEVYAEADFGGPLPPKSWATPGLRLRGPAGTCDDDPTADDERNGEVDSNGEAGDPVTPGTGNFVYAPEAPRVLSGLDVLPTYNSRPRGMMADFPSGSGGPSTYGSFGRGWVSLVDVRVQRQLHPTAPRLTLRTETGRVLRMAFAGTNAWSPPAALRASSMVRDASTGQYTLTFLSGEVWRFSSGGRLLFTETVTGQRVEIERNQHSVPTRVVARSGGQAVHAWKFVDAGTAGLIDEVVGPYDPALAAPPAGTPTVKATYDSAGRMATMSAPYGFGSAAPAGETFTYVGSTARIDRIERARGGSLPPLLVVDNDYDDRGRVSLQTNGLGEVDTFDYDRTATGMVTTVVSEAGSTQETVVYTHDAQGRLASVFDPYEHTETYEWDGDLPADVTTRRGASTEASFDAEGRVGTVELADPVTAGASAGTVTQTLCGPGDPRPVDVTDAAGVVTRFWWTSSTTAATPCEAGLLVPRRVTRAFGTAEAWDTTYEESGGLVTLAVQDPGGDAIATRFNWTSRRMLASKVDYPNGTSQPGRVTYYGYDAAGRPLVTRDPAGVETWTVRDAAGRVISEVGPVAVARSCGATSCTFGSTPPAGSTRQWSYLLDGSLASTTDGANQTTTQEIEHLPGGGRRVTVTAPPHGAGPSSTTKTVTVSVFDAFDRLISQSIGDPAVAGSVSTTTFEHDPLGRVAKVRQQVGPVRPDLVMSYDYDADGNQTVVAYGDDPTVTDNHQVKRRYDLRGRLVEEWGPTGDTSAPASVSGTAPSAVRVHRTWTYDAADRLLEETTGDGPTRQRVLHRYDVAGRKRYVIIDRDGDGGAGPAATDGPTDPDDHVVETTYTGSGLVDTIIEPPVDVTEFDWSSGNQASKRTTDRGYDQAGQHTSTVDALGKTTTYSYGLDGSPLRTTLPGGYWTERFSTYTATGRVDTVRVPSPTGVDTADQVESFDARGAKVAATDQHQTGTANPPTTTWTYWDDGLVKSATNPNAGANDTVTTYYDARGNRVARTSMTQPDALAPAHLVTDAWSWDLANRLVSETPAGAPAPTSYGYDDLHGWQTSRTQPSGRTQTRTHWNSGKVRATTSTKPADAFGPADTHRSCSWYDSVGNETHQLADEVENEDACTGGAVTERVWDRSGDLVEITTPDTPNTPAGQDETLRYAWDLGGRPRTFTYADGTVHQFLHDAVGRHAITAVSWPGGGGFPIVGYLYDDNGNRVLEGLTWSEGSRSWTYPANGSPHPTSYVQQIPGANRSTVLSWRPDGRLGSEATGASTRSYSYDAAGQLLSRADTAGPDHGYVYGPRGLRLSSSVDGAATSYTYNDRAQLVGSVAVDDVRSYEYDPDGRRVLSDFGSAQRSTAYDARGLVRRIETDVAGSGEDLVETVAFDANRQLTSYSTQTGAAAAVDWSYTWDPTRPGSLPVDLRVDDTLWARSNFGLEFVGLHFSSQAGALFFGFDVQRSVVASSSNPSGPSGYDPFGLVSEMAVLSYGYRSELVTYDTVHLRNRDYQVSTGTFTVPDPLDGVSGTVVETNPYHYVGNDPVNRTDRLGLAPDECSGLLGRFLGRGCEQSVLVETALGFVPFYDCYNVVFNGARDLWSLGGCAADLVLPVSGPLLDGAKGLVKHGDELAMLAAHQDDIIDVVKHGDELADAAKHLDEVPSGLGHRPGGGTGASDIIDDLPVTCAHSFAGTTPVLMANGTRTPISEVTVGDHVLATNPDTGETGAREVLATLPHTDQLLTLKTSSGEIVTTEDHRYWNASDEEWQESQDLDAGDRLLTADGDEVTVEGLDWTTLHTDAAYDLTIDDLHTFYVAAGDDAVLVHNCNGVKVLDETLNGRGIVDSAHTLSADDALDTAEAFLGPGYRESLGQANRTGQGVFTARQPDGTTHIFRMDPASLSGAHRPGVAHVHFKDAAGNLIVNNHVRVVG